MNEKRRRIVFCIERIEKNMICRVYDKLHQTTKWSQQKAESLSVNSAGKRPA
jgi:hypothetical protein